MNDIPDPTKAELTARAANLEYVKTVGRAAAENAIVKYAPKGNFGRRAIDGFLARSLDSLPIGLNGMVKEGMSPEAIAAWTTGWSEVMAAYIRAEGTV